METMELPAQAPPVSRELLGNQANPETAAGVEASQSVCDQYTGIQQQICYALEYGIAS